jgi:multidrug efflux pump subunit AcrA (membrane-fusion protein)
MADPSLFRPEALEFRRQGGARGDVLELTPRAFFVTHWLLVLALLGIVGFALLGQIDEYAAGLAVVRLEGLSEVTAPRPAVVAGVDVAPGERVQPGQVLVRMYSAAERSELESVERELADQLAKLLRNPGDAAAREALVALRGRRDLARGSLERQTLRAPQAGIVGDVRVRPGQMVEPGAALVTLLGERSGARLTALLPGRYRPLLSRGMQLRFIADGFPREVHRLVIERVGDQIIGPTEAMRYVGSELPLPGPVVLVQARLPSRTFTSEGRPYSFHHGMQGHAECAVRRDSLAFTLVPGLRSFVDNLR